jgi:tetratricopeptide (TPR) repeat protein
MDPNFALSHRYLGLAYEQKGMYEEAISEFQRSRTLSATRPLDSGSLGYAYALAGRPAEARQIVTKASEGWPQAYFPALDIALVYVGLNEKDLAFEWLEKAVEEHSPWLIHLNVDPRFDPIRSDPRFTRLVRRVGFAI